MAENSNQIGILFGVSGGSSIGGESGRLIVSQLQGLALEINTKSPIEFVAHLDVNASTKQIQSQLNTIAKNINFGAVGNNITKKANTSLQSLTNNIQKMGTTLLGYKGKLETTFKFADSADITKFRNLLKALQDDYDKFTSRQQNGNLISPNDVTTAQGLLDRLEKIKLEANQLQALSKNKQIGQNVALSNAKVLDKITLYLQKYQNTLSKSAPKQYQELLQLQKDVTNGVYNGTASLANNRFLDITKQARLAGGEVETLGQKIKRVFSEKFGYGVLAAAALYARQAFVKLYENVVNIDTAMTELKKVTEETDATYSKFLDNAAERAEKLGATIADTVSATADFARLGYNLEDASNLADTAVVYKNVGDGISDISTASESIISTIKAFNIEAKDAMSVVDKFNETGNRFAISSGGVGEVLLRSASALAAANNSLDESIALGTAANEIIQSPEKVGNALKVVSMYLRSAKSEAEDAGESTEGMVESVSKLRNELKNLTGGQVDILQADGQTYKSTYQILKELSQVWDSLTDLSQANILEMIGGKRNANVTSALIKNFSKAEEVLNVSANSAGSALAENEKYLESIQGKISQLKATIEALSQNLIDSSAVKWVIDFLNNVLQKLTSLTSNKWSLTATLSGLIGGVALSNSKVPIGLKKDDVARLGEGITALKEYKWALANGLSEQDAFNLSMSKAPQFAQNTAQSLKENILSYRSMAGAIGATIIQKGKDIVVSTALTAATTLLNAAISMGISLIAQAAVSGIAYFVKMIPTTKRLTEQLSNINSELADLKSENESLNSELQTTADRIKELEDKGSLTLVEENELEKLRQTNAELRAKIALNNAEQKQKQKDQTSKFVKWMEKQGGQYRTDENGYAYGSKKDIWDKIFPDTEHGLTNWQTYDFSGYIQNQYSRLDYLQSQYQEALKSGNKKQAEQVKKQIDNLQNELEDKYSEIEEQASQVEYIANPNDEEKKLNDYLDTFNVLKARIVAGTGDISGAWTQITTIPRFSEIISQLTDLGNAGELTGQKLAVMASSNELIAQLLELLGRAGLIDWKKIFGDNYDAIDRSKDGLVSYDEIQAYATDNAEQFAEALSGVANQFKAVQEATEEAEEQLSSFLEKTKSLTESFEDISGKKDSIADILAELRDDGQLSAKSMSTLFDDFSNVEGFEDFIKVLTSSKSSVQQQKDALNGLYSAYIDSKGILSDVTEETYDYTVAQLKALGVTNATEVATAGLASSLTNAAIEKGNFNEQTAESIRQQLLEKGASEAVGNQYIQAARACIEAQNKMTQAISAGVKSKLQSFGIELKGIKNVADAYQAMYNTIKKKYWNGNDLDNWAKGAGFEQYARTALGDDVYNSLVAYGAQAEAAANALAQINGLQNQLGSGMSDIKVNVPATEKSSSSKDKDPKIEEFDDWYTRLKWQRDNNIIDETNFLKQLDAKYRSHFSDRTKYLEQYAKYSQEVYEGFKKLYQDDLNAQKDSLEKQKEELKDLADARKQALEDAKDEEDYKKEQSDKREEINKLKVLIASFRGTLSLSSQKKLRELQEQLKEKEDELAEFENDKALERAKENIDKEYENQEKAINAQIGGIEEQLEKINDDLPDIRNAVIAFAQKYGVPITRAYASGTSSVPAITQENGAEIIAGNVKRGQFTMLTPSSKVWNANATQALWDFANSPEAFIGSVMERISAFKNKAMSMIYSQPVSVTVGGITIEGNADNQTVQKIKQSQKEQVESILKGFKKLQ